MKTKYIGMLTVMAMLSLTACSNNEVLPQEPSAEGLPICFKISTEDMQSRASHANANTIDQFGLRIQSQSVHYPDKNLTFTGSVEGSQRIWTPDENVLWKTEAHKVNMCAFYPKGVGEDPMTKETYINIEENQTNDSYEGDILRASIIDFDPSTLTIKNPAINLEFQHIMSQLQVVITFPEGTSPEKIQEVETVSVNGTKKSGMMYFFDKDWVNLYHIGNVNAYRSEQKGNTATFKCILIPQTVVSEELTISFVFDGNNYEWNPATDITFAENTIHTLNLTVGKASVQKQSLKSRNWGGYTANEVIANSMN